MRIGRTIPPAASPISLSDILKGVRGLLRPKMEIERFRKELEAHFDVKHCFLVSSGKAALALILRALHDLHPSRDEVLIPAFCCYSLPSAIVRAGLKIRLCDMDPETLDFDFSQLEGILAGAHKPWAANGNGPACRDVSRLLAVIPVHLFGLVADVARVHRAIPDQEIAVIEDAAQVMGSEAGGRKVGTLGDVGFFSLGRGKVLSTGEGGVVVTNRDDIADRILSRLQTVPAYPVMELAGQMAMAMALTALQRPSVFWIPKSLPFLRVGDTIYDPDFKIRRLSAFQAGLAKDWRTKLANHNSLRRYAARRWSALDLPDGTLAYRQRNGASSTFIRYPLRILRPDLWKSLLNRSQREGLGIMLTYPDSIDGIPEIHDQFEGQGFPAARNLARQLLTVPVHPLLSRADGAKLETTFRRIHNEASTPSVVSG